MIGNGFEFYFHWRQTFDVSMIKKSAKVTFSYNFTTFFYSSKGLIFPCDEDSGSCSASLLTVSAIGITLVHARKECMPYTISVTR